MAHGQTLRLDDLFTSPTQAVETAPAAPAENPDPSRSVELLAAARADLEARRYPRVLETTTLLSAWLARGSAEYGEVLWLRGSAYEALNEREKLAAVCLEYLDRFPKGDRRGWFLVRVADEKAHAGALSDAAVFWEAILKEELPFTTEESLRGGALMVQALRPVEARRILERGFASVPEPPDSQVRERNRILVESLLIRDDPQVAMPAESELYDAASAAYMLRLGVLAELRNDPEAARALYDRVAGEESLLEAADAEVLKQRREGLAKPRWPVAAKPKEDKKPQP